jgi:hypothetical protein
MPKTKANSKRARNGAAASVAASDSKEVPIQVMVPEDVRRQVAMMGAENGENIRTIVLRGLQKLGIEVPDSELIDRRGRRRSASGGAYGTK